MTRFVYELVSQAKLFCICCINEGVGKFLLSIVLGGEKIHKMLATNSRPPGW